MAALNDNGTNRLKTSNSDAALNLLRDSIDSRHGIYFIICTILFFQFVNWIIKSQGPPKTLRDDEWKWRNLYVSWIHALIVSIWTLSSFFFYPELMQDLLDHINYFTYFNVCFGTGYFMYDFLDLLVNNKLIKMWELTLHHIAVVGMFYYNIRIKANIAFNLVALLVEVNSFFLHWRKLLQMVGTSYHSRKYLIVKYMNLASFVTCRFGPCILIDIALFMWRLKVSQVYYFCICLSMVFMNILNVILFSRLYKSDILRGSSDGRQGSACHNIQQDCHAMNGYEPMMRDNSLQNNNFAKMSERRKEE